MAEYADTNDLGLLAGDTLDKYRLVRELGAGGMGQVWLAQDPNLEREVAVKVLLPEYSSDPRFRERFRREAQTMMDLQNAPIVGVMNYFEAAEPRSGRLLAAMVMQYMAGGTLEDRMAASTGQRLPLSEALQVAADALGALAEIHEMDIVHRDLKPSNFLFTQHGKIRISDFGIAIATDTNQRLTQARGIIGTATYMSPEQAMGEFELDHRSDVYSFGVVLFEMLTGRVPFECTDRESRDPGSEIRKMHLQSPPPRLQGLDSGLDPWLDRVIQRALAKRKEDRWQSCREFQQAIAACARRDEKQLAALLGVAAPAARQHPPTVLLGGTGTEVLTDLGPTPGPSQPAPGPVSPPAPAPIPVAPQRSRTGLFVGAAAVLVLLLGYFLGQAGILPLPPGLLWTENLLEQANSNLENGNPCRARDLFDGYLERRPNDTTAQQQGQLARGRCAGDAVGPSGSPETGDLTETGLPPDSTESTGSTGSAGLTGTGPIGGERTVPAVDMSICNSALQQAQRLEGNEDACGALQRLRNAPPLCASSNPFQTALLNYETGCECDQALQQAQQLENDGTPCRAVELLRKAPKLCGSVPRVQTALQGYTRGCDVLGQ